MRLYGIAASIALSLAFLNIGCNHSDQPNSGNSSELEFKVQSLQREIDELRSAQNESQDAPRYTPSTNPNPTP